MIESAVSGFFQFLIQKFKFIFPPCEYFWLFSNSREIDLQDKPSKYGISFDISDFITFWLLWILSILLTADAREIYADAGLTNPRSSAFISGSLYFQLTGRTLQNRYQAAE